MTYLPVCVASLPPEAPLGLAPEDAPDVLSGPLPVRLDEVLPEDSAAFAFLAFLDFFLAFGFSSVAAAASVPVDVPEEVAEGDVVVPLLAAPGLVDVAPEVPLAPVVPAVPDVPDALSLGAGAAPDVVPAVPVPVAPLPVVDDPELPLMPLELDVPDAPEEVSLAPDAPDGLLLDGMELEAPLDPGTLSLPVVPGVLCERTVDEGEVSLLLPLVALLCASAMEDTDATTTSDSERRVVFNVMNNSLLLKKDITDAAVLMQRLLTRSANSTTALRQSH